MLWLRRRHTLSKRQEPKKAVVSVEKVGVYPNVWWEHRLACGHLEKRKRRTAASKIACGQCGAAQGGVEPDDDATLMQYEGRVRAWLANEYHVEVEMVTVEAYMDGGYPKVGRVSVGLFRDVSQEIA